MAYRKAWVVALSFTGGALAFALGGSVRSASARDEPRPAYFCFETSSVSDLSGKANAAGQRGWEMVSGVGSAAHSVWCFKRGRGE